MGQTNTAAWCHPGSRRPPRHHALPERAAAKGSASTCGARRQCLHAASSASESGVSTFRCLSRRLSTKHRLIPRRGSHHRASGTSITDSVGSRARRHQQFGSATGVEVCGEVNAQHGVLHRCTNVHRRPQLHQAPGKTAEPIVRSVRVDHARNCEGEYCADTPLTAPRERFQDVRP